MSCSAHLFLFPIHFLCRREQQKFLQSVDHFHPLLVSTYQKRKSYQVYRILLVKLSEIGNSYIIPIILDDSLVGKNKHFLQFIPNHIIEYSDIFVLTSILTSSASCVAGYVYITAYKHTYRRRSPRFAAYSGQFLW